MLTWGQGPADTTGDYLSVSSLSNRSSITGNNNEVGTVANCARIDVQWCVVAHRAGARGGDDTVTRRKLRHGAFIQQDTKGSRGLVDADPTRTHPIVIQVGRFQMQAFLVSCTGVKK